MNRRKWRSVLVCVLLGGMLWTGSIQALAQPAAQDMAGQSGVADDDLAASKGVRSSWLGTVTNPDAWSAIWAEIEPHFGGTTVIWVAVVVILLLTLQGGTPRSWCHTCDGLILALTVLLLPLRSSFHGDDTLILDQSVKWICYLLLTLVGVYWLVRGLGLLLQKNIKPAQANVSVGASFVLIIAGFFLANSYIAREPVTPTSYDGLIGGVCVADTGKLPYGDAPAHDHHSPMLYLVHGGMVKLGQLTASASDSRVDVAEPSVDFDRLQWSERQTWLRDGGWDAFDTTPMQLVNLLLFALLLLGLAGIGHRLHSVAMGQTIVALCCFFPGVMECLIRPEVMIPAVLLTWAIAFIGVPGLGSLLAGILLVFAGLAWPWAWLLLPAFLAYYFRRGWHTFGSIVGVFGAFAAIIVGIATLIAPAPPRGDGALHAAGLSPDYTLMRAADGTLVVEPVAGAETPQADFKSGMWNTLLQHDPVTLGDSGLAVMMPAGIEPDTLRYEQVSVADDARDEVLTGYRTAMSTQPPLTRFWVGLRTLLENTWLPDKAAEPQHAGTWEFWAAQYGNEGRWTIARRTLKVVLGLLALFVAYLLYRGRQPSMRELLGSFLVICAGAALISQSGMITNWAWFIPVILSAYACRDPEVPVRTPIPVRTPAPAVTPRPAPRTPFTSPSPSSPPSRPPGSTSSTPGASDLGAAPRITIEQEKD